MTERISFVAVKGSLRSRPSAGGPLTEMSSAAVQRKTKQPNTQLKEKSNRLLKSLA